MYVKIYILNLLTMTEILQVNNIWEYILIILISYYIILRLIQRKLQKRLKLNNFEFWVFYHLKDLYKFNWYPFEEEEALKSILIIKRRIEKWI